MRPHTRTHCSRKGECESPGGGGEQHFHGGGQGQGGSSGLTPGGRSRGNPVFTSGHYQLHRLGGAGGHQGANRQLALVELPAELIIKILESMSFKENSCVRLVCRRLNELCAARLNATFQRLQNNMLVRFQAIKSQMPRRESARRNHPLARECDIVETLHMRLTLLQMTFGKHIERKHICFFPGEILDEVFRILSYITSTQPLGRAYKVTDELFDLSTMAMEYFKENIEPSLPEITYFGSDFLDFTPPFATPSKRLQLPSLTDGRGGVGFDSPISSRASAVGSSCSEPPLPYNNMDGVEGDYEEGREVGSSTPQSNMVLRKRIRRIRAGMKKYNTQLDEVKRELKSCKSKMDGQSKQVSEYASRLDDYDKKFEENSRRFGTLLTELNKCKTELQYYRSRSHIMQCLNCGSNLTDPPFEEGQEIGQSGIRDSVYFNQAQVDGFPFDKQAMVADWLNPVMDASGNTIEPVGGHHHLTLAAPLTACGGPDPIDCGPTTANSPCPPPTPQVQDFKLRRMGTSTAALHYELAAGLPGTSTGQNKIYKTDDDLYLRSGPGSPGYTRSQSPRSPESPPGSPNGAARTGKRKSRDDKTACPSGQQSGGSICKTTRCKRPKVSHNN